MSIARAAVALALLVAGCGAAQGEKATQCREACGSAYMTCLEQGSCVDTLTGQVIPCEEECGASRATCERACP